MEKLVLYQETDVVLKRDEALEKAKTSASTGNYEEALSILSEAMKENKENAELKSAYSAYSEEYVNHILLDTDTLVEEKDFDGAITILNEALKLVPENEALKSKLNEVKGQKPVSLATMNAINGGLEWNTGTPTDPFGITYSDVVNYVVIDAGRGEHAAEDYAEYRLYGEYKSLSFQVVTHADIPEDGYGSVQVYADDTLVFTSQEIRRKTDKQTCEVDVSNADYIKIVVNADKGESDFWSDNRKNCILLMDCVLSK